MGPLADWGRRYKIDTTFVHLKADKALETLQASLADIKTKDGSLKKERIECDNAMDELKRVLYAKFGGPLLFVPLKRRRLTFLSQKTRSISKGAISRLCSLAILEQGRKEKGTTRRPEPTRRRPSAVARERMSRFAQTSGNSSSRRARHRQSTCS